MCGIIGYIGKNEALPVLLAGLKKLEYRGYDSAGVALLNGSLEVFKKLGKVSELELFVQSKT
jgi:glutamine---fructose-6-phosphate transaminase (isomerizing)